MRYLTIIFTFILLASCNVGQGDLLEKRFKSAVANLRQAGLFERYKDLDDERVTKILIEKARTRFRVGNYDGFSKIFDPNTKRDFFDLCVAELNETRVW